MKQLSWESIKIQPHPQRARWFSAFNLIEADYKNWQIRSWWACLVCTVSWEKFSRSVVERTKDRTTVYLTQTINWHTGMATKFVWFRLAIAILHSFESYLYAGKLGTYTCTRQLECVQQLQISSIQIVEHFHDLKLTHIVGYDGERNRYEKVKM